MQEFKLLHLYYKTSSSKHKEAYQREFNTTSIDIEKAKKIGDFDLYIIEINDSSIEIVDKILNLFLSKQHPTVFADATVTLHTKLQTILHIRFTVSQKHDTPKVIKKISDDFKRYNQQRYFQLFSEEMVSDELYYVYENKKILYKSKKIDEEFHSFETIAKDIEGIKEVILKDEKYFVKKIEIADKIFTHLVKYEKKVEDEFSICTRLGFIETLKNKFLESSDKKENLSLITINIKNFDGDLILVEMIDEIKFLLPNMLKLCQYDGNFYVAIYEKIDSAKVINVANELNIKLHAFIKQKDIDIPVEIFHIDLTHLEITYILQKLNYLSRAKIDKDIFADGKTTLITTKSSDLNGHMVLRNMLELMPSRNARIKLYNLHNGVVISSNADFLQFKHDSLFLRVNKKQASLIAHERKTVLKLYMYDESIEMSLEKIDRKNMIAMFHNLKLSEKNITKRKYTRVMADPNMVVSMIGDGKTFKGNILDLSIKSIATVFNQKNMVEKLEGKEVDLIFELVLVQSKINHKVKQRVKISSAHVNNAQGVVKLICDLIPNAKNEEILTRYIHSKEKNIIENVKDL